jgi:hypothetical protein
VPWAPNKPASYFWLLAGIEEKHEILPISHPAPIWEEPSCLIQKINTDGRRRDVILSLDCISEFGL